MSISNTTLTGGVDALIDGGDCDFGVESTIIKINGSGILLRVRGR